MLVVVFFFSGQIAATYCTVAFLFRGNLFFFLYPHTLLLHKLSVFVWHCHAQRHWARRFFFSFFFYLHFPRSFFFCLGSLNSLHVYRFLCVRVGV